MEQAKRLKWNIIGPVGLIVLALVLVFWFDITKGGEATPAAPLGNSTPVRFKAVAPTATPFGFAPTPKPKPTVAPSVGGGTAFVRDEKRRSDLLLLLAAAAKVKAQDGSYPTTRGNVQTLCTYKDIDLGCKIQALAVGGDAVADPAKNGYWYSSDGVTAKFYASLEEDVPQAQQCKTTDVELLKRGNIICVTAS